MAMSREVVLAAVAELRAQVVELKSARGIMAILAVAPAIVQKVEALSVKLGIKGADKKDLALDILFALLPPLPWWLPEAALRAWAGVLIERAVAALSKRLGK